MCVYSTSGVDLHFFLYSTVWFLERIKYLIIRTTFADASAEAALPYPSVWPKDGIGDGYTGYGLSAHSFYIWVGSGAPADNLLWNCNS